VMASSTSVFFFFQAEDGIRYFHVTGVQTCALPIFGPHLRRDGRDRSGVVQVDAGRLRLQARSPVQQAGVHVRQVVQRRQPRGDGALARRGGPVHGDHESHPVSPISPPSRRIILTKPGMLGAIMSASPTPTGAPPARPSTSWLIATRWSPPVSMSAPPRGGAPVPRTIKPSGSSSRSTPQASSPRSIR